MLISDARLFVVTLILAMSSMTFALNNGLGLTPPMGYSSWNDCASEVTEERIKNVTRALISTGLAAKGYVHVNVDEGWLLGRNETTGEIIEDLQKFPSGMKALGDWIHNQTVPGKGKIMKYGLYTSRGTVQCGTAKYNAVGSHGFEAQDAAWFAAAGADYAKIDSCGGSQDHDTAFSDYSKWRDGFNKTGRPIYFSLCGWHTWYAPVGAKLGNSWRIAGDGTNWYVFFFFLFLSLPLSHPTFFFSGVLCRIVLIKMWIFKSMPLPVHGTILIYFKARVWVRTIETRIPVVVLWQLRFHNQTDGTKRNNNHVPNFPCGVLWHHHF